MNDKRRSGHPLRSLGGRGEGRGEVRVKCGRRYGFPPPHPIRWGEGETSAALCAFATLLYSILRIPQ